MLNKKQWFQIVKSLSLLTQLGLIVIICVFGCTYVGIYLDRRLNTSPLFAIIFILLGIGSAFVSLYRTLESYIKKRK
ncbi:ATP synthase [Peptostreptococcus russellii]|uniref:ATP synthase n=1 Tax=Peptostreptococcus russellii TaxID=215200 RepID=A0A2P7PZ39_9FIRM|nr:ATP synthase [Peptostreptococcus russellii]